MTTRMRSSELESLVKEPNVAVKIVVDLRRCNRRTDALDQPPRLRRRIGPVGNPLERAKKLLTPFREKKIHEQPRGIGVRGFGSDPSGMNAGIDRIESDPFHWRPGA